MVQRDVRWSRYIDNRPTGGSGCNIENSGATVAINDLLASVHGHGANSTLRLFPGGWPVGQAVSFEQIRVRGAFLVSASATGGAGDEAQLSGSVIVSSLAGNLLRFLWPRPGVTPTVSPATRLTNVARDTWSFQTAAGRSYRIS